MLIISSFSSRSMRYFLIGLFFIGSILSCYAQASEKDKIIEVIELFFEGFHQADSLKMKSVLMTDAVFRSVDRRTENLVYQTTAISSFLKAVASRPSSPVWEERLNHFRVNEDGVMAQAWVSYSFWLDGTFSHCGIDAFTLVKQNDAWKIVFLIDTRSVGPCDSL